MRPANLMAGFAGRPALHPALNLAVSPRANPPASRLVDRVAECARHSVAFAATLVLALGAGGAAAAPEKTKPGVDTEVQARFQQDRAKCLNGSSQQDQATCLREASAARDAALQHQLDDSGARYDANARQRCVALTGDESRDCLARARGQGKKSGSVEGGGVLRETVTREVKPAASAP